MANRQKILNIEVDDISLNELLHCFKEGVLVTPNVDHLILLQSHQGLYSAYQHADYITVDSQIVFWAMKFLGRGVKEKISGSDFLPAFCNFHGRQAEGGKPTRKMFILGGKPGVAQLAMEKINQRQGCELVIGAHSPSMRFLDSPSECDEAVRLINESGADTVVVGLGCPKQELWIARHKHRLAKAKTFLAVGASIDFEAGVLDRAPQWMSKFGLEWFYRLAKEPKRLWRRYLVNDPLFFWLLLRDRMGVYNNPLPVQQASTS